LATIRDLTISLGDQLDLNNATTLELDGDGTLATLSNAGTLRLNSSPNATVLRFAAKDAVISGGGTIHLQNSSSLLNDVFGGRVTNLNNVIDGDGSIGNGTASFTNSGVIRSTTSGHRLAISMGNAGVNTGTIETSLGTISLSGIINNTGGTIRAQNRNGIFLNGAAITGGTLDGSGASFGASSGSLQDVMLFGGYYVANGNTAVLRGNIANHGTLQLSAFSSPTNFQIGGGTVMLTGGGVMEGALGTFCSVLGSGTLVNVDNTITGLIGKLGNNSVSIINQGKLENLYNNHSGSPRRPDAL